MRLYKYTPHNQAHKYDIILKNRLWFSKFADLNDPMDSNLAYKKSYSQAEKNVFLRYFAEKHCQNFDLVSSVYRNDENFVEFREDDAKGYKDNIGVLCMSSEPRNLLMWSHYANGFRGVVYEFDAENLFSNHKYSGFSSKPHKVRYADKYKLLSYAVVGEKLDKQCEIELLTKAKQWEYEREYRYIDLYAVGEKEFDKKCLKSIIFGARMDEKEIDDIIELCKKLDLRHIKIQRIKFIEGTFELEFDKNSSEHYMNLLLN